MDDQNYKDDQHIGKFIRKLRKQRGLTLKELAYGITNIASLSRLESGDQMLDRDKLNAILQRLGFNTLDNYSYFLDKREYEISKKCDELVSLVINNRNKEAEDMINELALLPEFEKGAKLQLLLTYRAAVMVNLRQDNDEIRRTVLKAIKITFPRFNEDDISSYFLSDQEVTLVNIWSITYLNENKMDKAIEILEKLIKALDNSKIDEKQRAKLYILLQFNLTKYYGLTGKYLDALEMCDIAIELCLNINNMMYLPGFIYNKAYCMYEMGYRKECRHLLYVAYYGFEMMENFARRDIVKNHAREKHGIIFDKSNG